MARAMKDSGIEWIGMIPEKWCVKKIKNIFYVYSGATPKSGVEEYWDGDIKWITPADYKTEDKYVFGGKRCISQSGYDACGTILVDENSIVFSKRAPIGTVAITKEKMCTNQGCLSCVNKENDSADYYYYLFSIATKEFEILGTGTTFKEISFDNFINVKVPVPEIDTQHKIVEFLDYKVSEINAIISKTKESVEEYKKYKQAVITEAVTKGIDDTILTKDSGIEWIGKIPKHWTIRKVKSYTDMISKGTTPKDMSTVKTAEYRIRYLKSENIVDSKLVFLPEFYITDEVNDSLERSKLSEKDIMFVIAGASIGKVAMMNSDLLPANTNQAMAFLRIKEEYFGLSKYIWYFLQSNIVSSVIALYSVQSAQPNLSMENLGNIRMPLSTDDSEIYKIIDYLDAKCAEIDALIEKKEAFVEEMETYKKSLIYEYVTGKKEVV